MGNPHVIVVSIPASGHTIPLLEFSKCLAKNGIKVTFVYTEAVHKVVMAALPKKDCIMDSIRLVSISGLVDLDPEILREHPEKAVEAIFLPMLSKKIEELIEDINESNSDKITCILADQLLGWAMEIGAKKGIKRAAFSVVAATMLLLVSSIPKLIADGIIDEDGTPTKKQKFRFSPTMPLLSTTHLGWAHCGNDKLQKKYVEHSVRDNKSMELSQWVVCNSCYDLEPAAFDMMEPKVRPVGPLLSSIIFADSAGSLWPEDSSCLKWLERQPPQSVIYVAFGSTAHFNQTQIQELAKGLELCNRPFLWVLRADTAEHLNLDAFLESFQDRVGSRGHVTNWVPQQKVLEHPSIACFLSHCGWNSTLEGVSNGVPFLCWPYFGDHFLCETYICDVWKVGLGFNRDEGRTVTGEEIKNKVEELLAAEKYRANALSLNQKIMKSVKQGGDSYNNIKNFVEWLNA